MTTEAACAVLGVSSSADEAELRSAYLQQVRENPPDRNPERFEQIRDAYECLRDPARRAALVLEGPDPLEPLTSLLAGSKPVRRFVGPQLWMEALREKRA